MLENLTFASLMKEILRTLPIQLHHRKPMKVELLSEIVFKDLLSVCIRVAVKLS